MHAGILNFVDASLEHLNIAGKRVIEVGSYDFNGTVRPLVMAKQPETYIGVDILEGSGVDVVCDAAELVDRFGENAFDFVLTTEMVEHARDWRAAISHMKRVLKPGGYLILTTRSIGYMYHGYPYDFWRYQIEDMRGIFDDFEICELTQDPSSRAGVFLLARKPEDFIERDLSEIALYSILLSRRVKQLSSCQEWLMTRWIRIKLITYTWWVQLPEHTRHSIKKILTPR